MTNFRLKPIGILKNSYRIVTSILKHPALLSSVLITGAVLGIRQLSGLQSLELLAYDHMMRLRANEGQDLRLLIVEVTEDDIRQQKHWPLSDATVARLLERLQQDQPRVIGLDIYRDIPYQPGEVALGKQLLAPNVITIMRLGDGDKDAGVQPPPNVPAERVSFSDFVVDPDQVIRRHFLYAKSESEKLYSFSLRLSLKYLENEALSLQVGEQSLQIGNAVFPSLTKDSGGYHGVDDRGYQTMLSYRSVNDVAKRVTLSQVLAGQVNPEWIRDKLVLIGTTAQSGKDFVFTPYNLAAKNDSTTPGILVHAQMSSQILSAVLDNRPLIWFWDEWAEVFWIFGWAVVGGAIAWHFRHPLFLGVATFATLAGLSGSCFLVFLQAGWIPFIPAAIALIGTAASLVVYRLLYDAFHDALTGLPNRALFVKHLQWEIARCRAPGHQDQQETTSAVAVLFLGLDSFKAINDSFGHRLGDQLLINTTQRLRNCLQSQDRLARVGGDEFAILRSHVIDTEEVTELADQLQQQVKLPFKLDGREVFTTASVGIVLDRSDSKCEAEDILRDAHTAMNRAKASGKARHEVFVTGMRMQVITRLQLETDLRHAIDRQEFQLYYQPLIALKTGKIAGFEALVRWHHPQRGFMPPSEFITIAEETNLIIPLSRWIIWEACRQLRIWHDQFPKDPPLLVSVNLSVKQFSQPDFVEQIEQCLEDTRLDGHHLKLEITESMAMNDVEATIALLQRLKALNLQLSIDDFGTGYSSLSYLHRFPANTIKVDRSFVSRMGYESEDAHIVQTIIVLGHNLGMDLVAEGVETAEQLAKLRSLGCEYGQGYFFAKPMAAEAMEALLKTDPQW